MELVAWVQDLDDAVCFSFRANVVLENHKRDFPFLMGNKLRILGPLEEKRFNSN